jgi:hypothetical protein
MKSKKELEVINKLNTPNKIQDFINSLEINFELGKETCMSPRMVLRGKKAHCMEGALLAAAILRFHGHRPLVIELHTNPKDDDHAIALFKKDGKWGAITKTNHAVLRYREPIYENIRELVMSYFHEYFDDNGRKNLRSYSRPVDLSIFDKYNWMTAEEDLWYIDDYLSKVQHKNILTKSQVAKLRKADKIEIDSGKLIEWKNP